MVKSFFSLVTVYGFLFQPYAYGDNPTAADRRGPHVPQHMPQQTFQPRMGQPQFRPSQPLTHFSPQVTPQRWQPTFAPQQPIQHLPQTHWQPSQGPIQHLPQRQWQPSQGIQGPIHQPQYNPAVHQPIYRPGSVPGFTQRPGVPGTGFRPGGPRPSQLPARGFGYHYYTERLPVYRRQAPIFVNYYRPAMFQRYYNVYAHYGFYGAYWHPLYPCWNIHYYFNYPLIRWLYVPGTFRYVGAFLPTLALRDMGILVGTMPPALQFGFEQSMNVLVAGLASQVSASIGAAYVPSVYSIAINSYRHLVGPAGDIMVVTGVIQAPGDLSGDPCRPFEAVLDLINPAATTVFLSPGLQPTAIQIQPLTVINQRMIGFGVDPMAQPSAQPFYNQPQPQIEPPTGQGVDPGYGQQQPVDPGYGQQPIDPRYGQQQPIDPGYGQQQPMDPGYQQPPTVNPQQQFPPPASQQLPQTQQQPPYQPEGGQGPTPQPYRPIGNAGSGYVPPGNPQGTNPYPERDDDNS